MAFSDKLVSLMSDNENTVINCVSHATRVTTKKKAAFAVSSASSNKGCFMSARFTFREASRNPACGNNFASLLSRYPHFHSLIIVITPSSLIP